MAALGVALAGACARVGAPPGGPEDRRPPVVVATDPEPYSVVEEFGGPVRFIFDERISERTAGGSLDDAVLVSPRTGKPRVKKGRQSLEVELDGGFQSGMVYRITLLPVVQDLFNNKLRDPFELVFSTGAELVESAVAGRVWDRVTGQGVADAQVLAVQRADSATYVSLADTGGVYAFRYLPPGRYDLVAFVDRNRNQEPDSMEVQGKQVLLFVGADTLLLDIPVLQPDTSPAQLTRVAILDSVTLLLSFDDYLNPATPASAVSVSLSREDGPAPGVARVFHEFEYVAWADSVRAELAREDSLKAAAGADAGAAAGGAADSVAMGVAADAARDTAAGQAAVQDTAAIGQAVQDTTDARGAGPDTSAAAATGPQARRRGPPPLPAGRDAGGGRQGGRPGGGGEPAVGPDGKPLPARRLVVLLSEPLEVNVAYQLRVIRAENLNGLPLGGGEAAVVLEPPPPDSAADSVPPRDTIPVRWRR
ncbi:MAG: Ig-like domain-containing protein [Gemmatimonadota bacterium]